MLKKVIAFVITMIMIVMIIPTGVFAGETDPTLITSYLDVSGQQFTGSGSLAEKLDAVFQGNVALFYQSTDKYALGSRLPMWNGGAGDYSVGGKITGAECYIYANGVYNYLFGDIPCHGDLTYCTNSRVVMNNVTEVNCDTFANAGVRFGAYLRTTTNADGSYNGGDDHGGGGHSLIILTYNENYVYSLEGNYDNNGLVCVTKMTWQTFNQIHLAGHGNRRIAHILQPTDEYYTSLGEDGGSSGSDIPDGYNYHDFQKIVTFLELTDEKGVKNGNKNSSNYDPNDPTTWNGHTKFKWSSSGRIESIRRVSYTVIENNKMIGNLDLSGCIALESLDIEFEDITKIDVSGCTALTDLTCGECPITDLQLAGCIKLRIIDLFYEEEVGTEWSIIHPITTLEHVDASGCVSLESLSLGSNKLSELIVKGCSSLEYLSCSNNTLTSLDVSNCTSLKEIYCNNNMLTDLDVSGCSSLEDLNCSNNALKNLDLAGCSSLKELRFAQNDISSIDFSNCPNINILDFSYNPPSVFEYDKLPKNLYGLYCDGLGLTALDISPFAETLCYLSCSDNDLSELDISACTKISQLWCSQNTITELDLSSCANCLYFLDCKNNPLGSIDISACTELLRLDVDSTGISALDVTNCPELYYLSCYNNNISELDVTNCKDLEELWCSKNRLTELDVSGFYWLRSLGCKGNRFTELDFSKARGIKIDLLTAEEGGTVGYYQEGYNYGEYDEEIGYNTVKVFAAPDKNYYFDGWYNESGKRVSTEATFEITSKKYTILTARFVRIIPSPIITLSTVAETGKVKVSWETVDGAAKYEVWRSASKDGTYTKAKTTTALSYTNTGANPGDKYYYKVRAVDAEGNHGEFCSPKYRYTRLAQPVVTGGHVADTGKNKLTWEAVDGAVKYEIWRSTSKDGTYTKAKTTTNLTYTNTAAEAGKTYYYKVVAVHSNTNANATSAIKTLTCDLPRPVITVKLSNNKPKISWKAIDGAVGYEVWRRVGSSGNYKLIKTTTNTSFANTGATAGTKYYYKVIAVHSKTAANSAYSAAKSITSK